MGVGFQRRKIHKKMLKLSTDIIWEGVPKEKKSKKKLLKLSTDTIREEEKSAKTFNICHIRGPPKEH